MRQPTTQGLYQYWNTVRGGRRAPRRYEIEPSHIAAILSETLILEHPDSSTCRVRVAGTQLGEWLGRDLRGELFYELWGEDDQFVLRDNMQAVVSHGAAALLTFAASLTGQDGDAQFEMLLLPLTHHDNSIERVLGSVASISTPDWLDLSIPSSLYLTSNQIIWPDGRPRPLVDTISSQSQALSDVPSLKQDASIQRTRLVSRARRNFLVYQGGLSQDD
jgi:hypothetical protein